MPSGRPPRNIMLGTVLKIRCFDQPVLSSSGRSNSSSSANGILKVKRAMSIASRDETKLLSKSARAGLCPRKGDAR
jgi:hypothetical protein